MQKTITIKKQKLSLVEVEKGIQIAKDYFEYVLSEELSLLKIRAPMFIAGGTGIQDGLSGVERPVSFRVKHTEDELQIPHSLAKWKRLALARYGFQPKTGLFVEMDAIRKDEDVGHLHSVYVDQWDWEQVITKEQRDLEFLKKTVRKIFKAIKTTESKISGFFPEIKPTLPDEITFIHSQELETMYPEKTMRKREDLITEKYGAVFIIGIGAKLKSGEPHDLRAPDYDDWTTLTELGPGLNGDLLLWHPIMGKAIEVTSMGIRVDKKALLKQLKLTNKEDHKKLYWHRQLLEDKIPLSIGGGIGRSRLYMFWLKRTHIGEVQPSIWDVESLSRDDINLL